MENEIMALLAKASKYIAKTDLDNDSKINLLKLFHAQTDELSFCRILAYIIDPKNVDPKNVDPKHEQYFLKSFIENVLNFKSEEISDDDCSKADVYTEYPIDNSKSSQDSNCDRRIDILIKIKGFLLPIEVKLFACDQPSQCYDYYQFVNQHCPNKHIPIYYLTLNGKKPSFVSIRSSNNKNVLKEDQYNCISMAGNPFMDWLSSCINKCNDLILKKLIGELIVNIKDKEHDNQAVELIGRSEKSFRSAYWIYTNYESYCKELMKKLFDTLDSKFREEFKLQKLCKSDEDLEYYGINEKEKGKGIDNFYTREKSSWPGLNYVVREISNNQILIFRIEIDYKIFCGFKILKKSKNSYTSILHEIEPTNLLNSHTDLLNYDSHEDNWLIWAYLPDKRENNSPDFKNPNQALFDLAEKFDEFVDKSIEFIGKFKDLFDELKKYDF